MTRETSSEAGAPERSLLDPPHPSARARFTPGFGPRVLLTIDTEEEFDWNAPFSASGYGVSHCAELAVFQRFAEDLGAMPLYLVDWPIANDPVAVQAIGEAIARGKAEVGVQLHPWVNPPHSEEVNRYNSYAGHLDPALERAKFSALRDRIEEAFAVAPRAYRAGRYGLGPHSAQMLIENGIALDTSVRALFDYREDAGGPDYTRHPVHPYWVDAQKRLLEAPLTSVHWGLLRQLGRWLAPLARRNRALGALLSRGGLFERIALTPEGVTSEEAIRGIDIALDQGLDLLVLSFHSPSLAPGHTPYVRDAEDVRALYRWVEEVYRYLDARGVRSTSVAEILDMVER